jgi:hypothetical protein
MSWLVIVSTIHHHRHHRTVEVLPSLMLWLNKFNIPGTIFFGKILFLPDYTIDLTAVVGKAMILPKIDNPTTEDVDKYHDLYCKNMRELFDKFKGRYAVEGDKAVLEII